MDASNVPPPLRERLGEAGTLGLLEALEANGRDWRGDVLAHAAERFEYRLVEECSKVRLDMANALVGMRKEMGDGLAALRKEMVDGQSALRQEMVESRAELRQEMAHGLANVRVEVIKWSFAFWLVQIVTLVTLLVRISSV